MSKSLRLVNGDLSISNRALDTVSGKEKLFQDLSLWIREKIGTDPMTPTYGSPLDGGIVNGQEVAPFIGRTINPAIQAEIQSIIYSLIDRYQKEQLEKIKEEATTYLGKTTFNADEIISTIDTVDVSSYGTTILARVVITTMENNSLTFILPMDNVR